PKLTRGVNHVQARIGDHADNLFYRPPLQDGKYRETVFAEDNIEVEPDPHFYKALLRPKDDDRPAFVTWKVETPTSITDLSYGGNVTTCKDGQRVSLYHSWDGKNYIKDFEQTKAILPRDRMVWLDVDAADVPSGAQAVYFRYEFEGGAGYTGPGIQSAAFSVNHEIEQTNSAPLEITYCWIEHRKSGDVERTHTEWAAEAKHDYVINVGGFRDPTMQWVRIKTQGDGSSVYGYSDGEDVGAGAEPVKKKFVWGKNLAHAKPYSLTGKQSGRNPDGGNDLTDGVVAPPDDYVSEKYMPTIVMFDKDVSPVVAIDLEKPQRFAAVRVFAGQPEAEPIGGYRFAYPDKIAVEVSDDKSNWKPVGFAEHNQVFDPPADYVPWEHDDDPMFASLPAGGRLHYGYRIIFDEPVNARYVRVSCSCREGWGGLLSEIQVIDAVAVDENFPPLVVIP
ncbi:discoidin domain-containing protein, partial [bacterium]|nr:discoidin domain-containing protein [bacterium]